MDLLGSLVDKSLVLAERTADRRAAESVRYRLLETVRQYAAQELFKSASEDELTAIRDRHAAFYLRVAEEAGPALTGRRQGHWLRRLDAEWENLRAAFGHLADGGRTERRAAARDCASAVRREPGAARGAELPARGRRRRRLGRHRAGR